MRRRLALLVALALVLVMVPVHAHHSFSAEFDIDDPVKVTGSVTKVEWTNPHVWFYLDVEDEAGKVSNWGFEMGGPNGLMRTGWRKNSMQIGELVTVEGWRAKNGTDNANARVVLLSKSGQRLFAASSGGNEPNEGAKPQEEIGNAR